VSALGPNVTPPPSGLDITVRTGSGTGRTALSAFDRALQGAGVADFNLITLSSVIPAGSRVRTVGAELPGGHGDALFCVRAQAFAEEPGRTVWAGLGWCVDDTGAGLFVEHRADSEAELIGLIEASLGDMNADRGGNYGPAQIATASARCISDPVCALVLAAYRVYSWDEPELAGAGTDSQVAASRTAPVVGPSAGTASQFPPSPPAAPPQSGPNGSAPLPFPVQTSALALAVEEPVPDRTPEAAHDGLVVTKETVVEGQVAFDFYHLYLESFTALETEAVARHVLTLPEFVDEMRDPRIVKYIAWSDGEAVGLTTLARDLSAVPWISPGYFAHHYPEQYSRGAVYYLGLTLVHPAHRGSHTYQAMFIEMSDLVLTGSTVVAWDMCAANDDRGFMRDGKEFVARVADAGVEVVDTQTYYVGTFNGPARNLNAEA